MKTMFTALASRSKFKINNRTCRAAMVWNPGACITSALSVLGHTRAGICRRPIATTQTWENVVEVLQHILAAATCKADFGKGCRVPNLRMTRDFPSWIPSATRQFMCTLSEMKRASKRPLPTRRLRYAMCNHGNTNLHTNGTLDIRTLRAVVAKGADGM